VLRTVFLSLLLKVFPVTDNPGAWFLHWCVPWLPGTDCGINSCFSCLVILIGTWKLVLRSYLLRHQRTMSRAQRPKSLLRIGRISAQNSTTLLPRISSHIQFSPASLYCSSDLIHLTESFVPYFVRDRT